MGHTKVQQLLRQEEVPFKSIWHPMAYSAQKTAASAHIPGKEFAKPVMVRLDGKLAMVVVPGSTLVDLQMLREATGAKEVRLAGESEFKNLFPDCEVGAMPPFGHLYNVPTFVAEKLSHDDIIAFNAGTHNELIEMTYRDYARIEHPQVIHVAAIA
ncbi:Ala-tRNA(Pro) deacylase [Breznakibacter xylanolyticus]|uniref:Ala-tRNA(Pro) deacylase n=1 Tax=Breznakibacter xylanolyticus TaxID=990 RepID=A0A2W7N729_9BACT|nr:YbaK/EbsC family protein [Breznakibacter xylanolyticus]MBN2743133.1 YbaK/EbsC family protein [Marinilabiliaceae bacterium]PZX15880.1 Ala-tRNA(Pro) deacylase [Breznakibacter xylanolyticus]